MRAVLGCSFRIEALAIGLVAILVGCVGQVQAQAPYPTRPVTLIVGFPAGGQLDLIMRALAEAAGKKLGQPVIVDNRTGASGTLGASYVATSAKPDGYTIAQMAETTIRVPLMQKVAWDVAKDFTYVIMVGAITSSVYTAAEGPFKSWVDVVTFAKANPGKLTYGSPGAGTSMHIGMTQIANRAGLQLTHVPFKGVAEVVPAVLGGHVMIGATGIPARSLTDGGLIRVLAVWTEERSRNLPDVPTLKEVGVPLVMEGRFGIAGPKGMDAAIVTKLHDAFKEAMKDAAVLAIMDKFDILPRYMDSKAYQAYIPKAVEEERAALVAAGIKPH